MLREKELAVVSPTRRSEDYMTGLGTRSKITLLVANCKKILPAVAEFHDQIEPTGRAANSSEDR